ncbi:MAG TPA: hypothetical protein VGR59_01255 [Gemmatimonadaceae bacterium]|nr:hypothetical protein [Gemmatimonadaceae bacterium]
MTEPQSANRSPFGPTACGSVEMSPDARSMLLIGIWRWAKAPRAASQVAPNDACTGIAALGAGALAGLGMHAAQSTDAPTRARNR